VTPRLYTPAQTNVNKKEEGPGRRGSRRGQRKMGKG